MTEPRSARSAWLLVGWTPAWSAKVHSAGQTFHEVARHRPVPVTVVVNVPSRLDPGIESTAYFVLADALTNAAKHSAARHVELRAAVEESTLTLSIRDDGRVVPTQAGQRADGSRGPRGRRRRDDHDLESAGWPDRAHRQAPAAMTERTTVVLADDSVLLREGLAGMLARFGFDVVAQAGDADELIAAVDEHRPQLLVTDVRRPPGFRDEGPRAALGLRAAHPSLATAVLSQYVERTHANELLTGATSGVG